MGLPKKSTTIDYYKFIYRLYCEGMDKWQVAERLHMGVDTVSRAIAYCKKLEMVNG